MLLVLRYRIPTHEPTHADETHGVSPDRKRRCASQHRPQDARIRGYLATLRKQGQALLAALETLFAGQPLYPASA